MEKFMWFMMLVMMGFASPAWASKMNIDPYFAVDVSALQANLAGSNATSAAFSFIAGSTLNWISPNLGAEVRVGFGGQIPTFGGSINSYTAYFLKPSMEVTRRLDVYALLGGTTISMDIAGFSYADTSPSYGLGFTYHVPNESLSFAAEWVQYRRNSDQSSTNISGVSISGVSASFVFSYY
ncbi:porin family protein [Ghiorsea bivora]|uniref:outer membrane beta-barrel protein n=1 Tax=Ghiorsea bivora TaxID=1485545 RepID=UPI0005704420|nr:outer membrane beta-barrel protein [Ghiorsea bivora]